MFPDKILLQVERAKDNHNYNFLYLTTKEINYVFEYIRKKYLKEKIRIVVKVFDLEKNLWMNLDPVEGISQENGNDTTLHEDLLGLQGGVIGEHYHFSSQEHSKILQGNYIGDWDASLNLPPIPASNALNKDHFYRVINAGTTNIDGISEWETGDLIYSTGSIWIRIISNLEDIPAKKTTIIQITGTILQNTPISLISSGPNYTKSKDNGSLGSTQAYFEDKETIQVFRNGIYERKGENVKYSTSTSLTFSSDLKAGETLVILS